MDDPATASYRVVAVPYPGRGHINPMMNFCKLMVSKRPDFHIRVIVTEEWFGHLESEVDWSTRSISFTTIPNVLPSEDIRGSDLDGFLEAVQRDMEKPVEQVLDAIGAPPHLIIADSFLGWAVDLGMRRNTQVVSLWPASVSTFLLVHRHDHILKLSAGEECIEMPGVSPIRMVDLPGSFQLNKKRMADVAVKAVSSATKAKCIIFRSLKELEAPAIEALKADLCCPVFTIGPAIPRIPNTAPSLGHSEPNYISWLSSQQERSVLYVSLGSFMSASSSQEDELAAGLKASGVHFLWVSRNQTCQSSGGLGDKAMTVPWCDQMRVLSHPSVGGFLTHCGWNSTVETAFAGVPALTFPLGADQFTNSKMIVQDWGIGWRVKDRNDELVEREAISALLKRFMDLECRDRKELDRTSKELQAQLLESAGEAGSTSSFDEFLSQVSG